MRAPSLPDVRSRLTTKVPAIASFTTTLMCSMLRIECRDSWPLLWDHLVRGPNESRFDRHGEHFALIPSIHPYLGIDSLPVTNHQRRILRSLRYRKGPMMQ